MRLLGFHVPLEPSAITARPHRARAQPPLREMSRRSLPFFGSRAGGKPLSTRGALFAFGGGCDCADCGSLVPAALDRLATGVSGLSLGSRAEPPHPAAADAGLQCSAASDEPPAASAAGSSGPPMELTVPTVPTAKMANRRLCKELDEFEAIAAATAAATAGAGSGVAADAAAGTGAPSPGFSAAPLLPSNLFHWRASVQGPPGSP